MQEMQEMAIWGRCRICRSVRRFRMSHLRSSDSAKWSEALWSFLEMLSFLERKPVVV